MASMQILNIAGTSIPPFEKVSLIVPIDKGELFIMPTDTFWGLSVSPNFPASIKKLFEIKKRPLNRPLPLFPADYQKAEDLIGTKPPTLFRVLTEKFWPGPLTILVKSEREFAPGLTSPGNVIGLRIPNHPIAQELVLTSRERVLAVTSANMHGQGEFTELDDIRKEFDEKVLLMINSDQMMLFKPSTIVDITSGEVKIVREGAIPTEKILKAAKHRT